MYTLVCALLPLNIFYFAAVAFSGYCIGSLITATQSTLKPCETEMRFKKVHIIAKYSRTSVARTLMARLLRLFRTRS